MSSIKEKLVKKKTFIKYLISYMLVFILPILLILFHFYPETTKIIKKEAQGSEAVLLSQINDYVSIQVDSLFNCASAIHLSRDITSNLFFTSNEFNTLLIMQELKKITGTNPFIERAFLYSASNGKFYSHTGTISEDEFGKHGSSFYYENWKQEDIINLLNQTRNLVIRPSEKVILPYGNSINAVTFIIPIPLGSSLPYSVLMIVVEEKSFFSFMKNEFETHNGNIIILDSNNVPIVKKEDAEYLYTDEFISLLEDFDTDGFMQSKLLGTDYIISVLKSDSPAFKYVSLTPVNDLLKELNIAF
jgi:two-component system response regulator YesN